MSIKSLLQLFFIVLILLIIGSVYSKYLSNKKEVVVEINSLENEKRKNLEILEKKIEDLEEKNIELKKKIKNSNNIIDKKKGDKNKQITKKNINDETKEIKKESFTEKKEIKNLVKDVEYISVDQKGNRFNLLATSGKSNIYNNDILDLVTVRGKISSDTRDTIYIVSDFAQYNSVNLNSKFYQNVIINYQDKEITCINFDVNMETNKAIAYNDVIITDPKSIMKAGIVEFDLKSKNIDINPESVLTDIEIVTN